MRRPIQFALTLCILLCAAVLSGNSQATAAPSAPPSTVAASGPGLATLDACITREKHIDLAVLMDESGSLADTDPSNSRVTALKQLLSGLLSESTATQRPAISIELDGFAKTFDQVQPFGALTAATLPTFLGSAQGFAAKNTGDATDFNVGLSRVRDRLARRAATEGETACQAVILFTDGMYDVGSAHGDAAAESVLCQGGQVIDQLRGDGVALIAVGLGSDPATLLPKLVGAGGCGSIPAEAGLFLPASNVAALLAAFDLTTAILNGGSPGQTTYGRTRTFVLGADLANVQLLLQTPGAPDTATITAPDGTTVTLGSGQTTATQSGIQWIVATNSAGYLRVDGSIVGATQDHVGSWTLTYASTAASGGATDVVLFPDLRPNLAANQAAYLGTPLTLQIDTTREQGGPAEPAEANQPHRLTVTLTEPGTGATVFAGQAEPDGVGFAVRYTPPRTEAATSLDVFLRLDSLAPNGTVLTSDTTESTLPVHPPITFPSIQPTRINLGTIAKGHDGTISLTVVGGQQSGCALVGHLATSRTPSGVTNLSSRASDSSCVAVTPGQRRVITVTITPKGAGTGQVVGSLPVTLQDAAGHNIAVNIPVSGHLIVPIDQTRRLWLFVVLLALGAIVPLLVMYGIAWLGGRLKPNGGIGYLNIPVEVTASKVLAERPLNGPEWILKVLPIPDGKANAASISVPAGPHIDRRLSRSPFGAPIAVATAQDAHLIGSAGKTRRTPEANYSGLIPTRVDAAWLFSTSGARVSGAGEPTLRGSLTVLVSYGPAESDPLGAALASALRRLPDEAAALFDEQDRLVSQDSDAMAEGSADTAEPPLDDRFTSDPFA